MIVSVGLELTRFPSLLVFFLDIAESADAPVDEMIIGAINEKFEAFLLVLRVSVHCLRSQLIAYISALDDT
jgi:hypothetical protein